MSNQIKNFLLELFFPSFCLGCKKEGIFLCYDCKSTLEISEYNYCLCNKDPLRLPNMRDTLNSTAVNFRVSPATNGKCGRCKDKKLSGLYSALPYKEKFLTRKLIHQFKYEPYIKSLAKTLAEILLEHLILAKNLTPALLENSVIIPVPLEKSKWKDRGYNQSEELVKELGHMLNVPLATDVLIKVKRTESQMKLSKEGREKNLQGAFAINPVRNTARAGAPEGPLGRAVSNGVKNPQEIAGKKVFLIDDVYTTGATMEECAKTLKEAGAKQVWGIVIAREG